jgi:hypothetical protein
MDRVIPFSTDRITNPYNPPSHNGVDLGYRQDEEMNKVYANCYGEVIEVQRHQPHQPGSRLWGNFVLVRHPNGMLSRYCHLQDNIRVNVGDKVDLAVLDGVAKVDVTGHSIGKGFQGTVKRHNFGRGPMAHGSKNHREPGSIGAGTTPSRVYKGKKMAGNMGNEQVTVTKLKVVRIDQEKNLILIKGSLPGCEGRMVTIKPSRTKWN